MRFQTHIDLLDLTTDMPLGIQDCVVVTTAKNPNAWLILIE